MLKDKCLLEGSDLVEELDCRTTETICGGVNESSGFCLHNKTDIGINYFLKTPNGKNWKLYDVDPGGTHWHALNNTKDLSKWDIRFDSDLRAGRDYDLEYSLTPSLSKYKACDNFKAYNFRKVGKDFVDLYTA